MIMFNNYFISRLSYLVLVILLNSNIVICQNDSRINIPLSEVENEKNPITLDDIVKLRKPQEVRISPDGKTVAFILRQAFIDINAYRSALFIMETIPGSNPIKLIEEPAISNLEWSPDGSHLTYLSFKSGSQQVWIIEPIKNAVPVQLFEHKPIERHLVDSHMPLGSSSSAGVFHYEWSPEGRFLAFTSSAQPDSDEQKKIDEEGVVYDDELYDSSNLITKSWIKENSELWIFDIELKTEKKIWEVNGNIGNFQFSPKSRKIAVSYDATSVNQSYSSTDIGIINIDDLKFFPVVTSKENERGVSWSPDGKFIASFSYFNEKSSIKVINISTNEVREYVYDKFRLLNKIFWSNNQLNLIVSGLLRLEPEEENSLYIVNLSNGNLKKVINTDDRLSAFSMNDTQSLLACIRENPTTPPEIAIFDLNDETQKTVTTLNPEYKSILLGEITKIKWNNDYGHGTNGYLIKPLNFQEGRRYPFLIINYGFEGKFITDANWMTNYPAQKFSAEGYVVLLMNFPGWPDWEGKDVVKGRVTEGYSPLSSMKNIIEQLNKLGIIDTSKTGIMGLSHGCFLTEFAISHSSLFKVASAADGGEWNYWQIGNKDSRRYYERIMGGPPYGETLKNWVEFSPSFNAHKVKTPVLMQFNPEEAMFGLEFFTALRVNNVPVEFVVYSNESHVFVQPVHRINSMKANLDWFNFWLKGEEDSDPVKTDQYKRWHKLKEQHEKLLKEKRFTVE